MTIIIADQKIANERLLPEKIQRILSLIPNGMAAFDNMVVHQQAFTFASFEQFIEQLSIGISNSTLLFLPNIALSVDIKKLLELRQNDLDTLKYLSLDHSILLESTLSRYSLVNNPAFQEIELFFQRHPNVQQALQWSADLSANILFLNTLNYCDNAYSPSDTTGQQAANWALEQAGSLWDFSNYYRIYLYWLHRLSTHKTEEKAEEKTADSTATPGTTKPNTKEPDTTELDKLIATLTPFVLDNMECPMVTIELNHTTLNQAISQWQDTGRNLGFTDFSTGLSNLFEQLTSTDHAAQQANQSITATQRKLRNQNASRIFISQAGDYQFFQFDFAQQQQLVSIDEQGCLSVAQAELTKIS